VAKRERLILADREAEAIARRLRETATALQAGPRPVKLEKPRGRDRG
jgi:hypothetical protein